MMLGDRTRERRHELAMTQAQLANAMTRLGHPIRQQGIQQIEANNIERPRGLRELAEALDVTERWLLTGREPKLASALQGGARSSAGMIPIAGYIGAGGAVVYDDSYAKGAGIDEVEAPPGETRTVVALAIRGQSAMPFLRDGDVVFYTREPPISPLDLVNEQCVVHVAEPDGRTLLKIIKPGSKAKRLTLASWNDEDIPDAKVEWAAPVLWIRRRPRAPSRTRTKGG